MMRAAWLPAVAGVLLLAAPRAMAAPPTADECATADETAQALRKAGKIRAAKDKLLLCVSTGCPTVVKSDCADRLNEIEKAMPTLVFVATDAGGSDLSAVRVKMDGQRLADRLDGTALAVDPGEHEFRFEAAGLAPVTKKLVVHETEKERRVAVSFSAPSQASPSPGLGETESGDNTGSNAPWPAYVALGIGGVGLIVGVIGTVSAVMQNSTLAGECDPSGGCDPKYQPQLDRLHTDQIIAGVGFGVALVGAGVGTYLLLTSGSSQPKAEAVRAPGLQLTPRVGLGWFGVGGRF